jgi:hypothetical protein
MLSFANKFTIIARVGWTNLDNVRLSLCLDSGRDPWYRVLAMNFSGNDLGIIRRGNNCRCYFQESNNGFQLLTPLSEIRSAHQHLRNRTIEGRVSRQTYIVVNQDPLAQLPVYPH